MSALVDLGGVSYPWPVWLEWIVAAVSASVVVLEDAVWGGVPAYSGVYTEGPGSPRATLEVCSSLRSFPC